MCRTTNGSRHILLQRRVKDMECVAYMRVSTEKQAEEGNGLDSQKRDIENYCRKNELIITEYYIDDGYTGANMDRPQLQRLINDCSRKRVKCVVAFKLDRISRSMVDGIYIIERVFQPNGIQFKCVHDSVSYDSPMEQAYTQMMAVFAQLDKNTMLLRMRGGMLERVKQGYWMGGGNLPYCYSYNKETGILEQIPDRVDMSRKAMSLFLQGYSDERIMQILGFKNEITVRKILTSVVNVGKIPYKGEVYQGLHKPVFTQEEFDLLQQARMVRAKKKSYLQTEANLLTGLCYCGVCGCKMRYQKWSNGNHKIHCYSRDKGLKHLPNYNENCTNGHMWADEIESQVEAEILKISVNISKPTQKKELKSKIIEINLQKEQDKLKRLYELYAEGNDTVLEMIKEKESRIVELKNELKKEYAQEIKTPSQDFVYENIKRLADVWEHIDKPNKNKILKSVISRINIVNTNIEIILNDF